MTTYAEKLKDPRWQKKRLEILERDEWTCQNCGDKETTLHVHHMHYNRQAEPWDVRACELITLCEDCHQYPATPLQDICTSFMDLRYRRGFSWNQIFQGLMALDSILDCLDKPPAVVIAILRMYQQKSVQRRRNRKYTK